MRCAIVVIAAGVAASLCARADGAGKCLVPLVTWDDRYDYEIRVDGHGVGRLQRAQGPDTPGRLLTHVTTPGAHWYEARCPRTGCWRYMQIVWLANMDWNDCRIDLWPELPKLRVMAAGWLVVVVALAGLTFGDAICRGCTLGSAATHGFLVLFGGIYWPVYMLAVQKECRV